MPTLELRQDYYVGIFNAMASPCEILIDTTDETIARKITNIAASEAIRIEQKLSRYRKNNIIHQINTGEKVTVDDETARLLDYSQKLFELSDARFDITAGVLRRAWKFDGSDNVPGQDDIEALLPLIGWEKIQWENPDITLPKGMEIDLGGIGKEYAVDRAAQQVQSFFDSQNLHSQQVSVLLNFGGDISVLAPKNHQGRSWMIGIDTGINGDSIDHDKNNTHTLIVLTSGGVATSGDSRRFLIKDNKRYGHILDPRTGWPVQNAPASVTVAADTCTDAGMMSTLALLHGSEAETFLNEQGVDYWLRWEPHQLPVC
jgi:thiamine biosynthesis lipoprotein